MGWGAAYALAEEWSEWCSGPEEAYEILYGGDDQCPVCGHYFNSPDAALQHARSKHKRQKHQAAIAEYASTHGLQ